MMQHKEGDKTGAKLYVKADAEAHLQKIRVICFQKEQRCTVRRGGGKKQVDKVVNCYRRFKSRGPSVKGPRKDRLPQKFYVAFVEESLKGLEVGEDADEPKRCRT